MFFKTQASVRKHTVYDVIRVWSNHTKFGHDRIRIWKHAMAVLHFQCHCVIGTATEVHAWKTSQRKLSSGTILCNTTQSQTKAHCFRTPPPPTTPHPSTPLGRGPTALWTGFCDLRPHKLCLHESLARMDGWLWNKAAPFINVDSRCTRLPH